MSLRVWLPLNGDLRNNGLSDVTVTNNNATIDNNGKIGKCYSFNGSNSGITFTTNILEGFKNNDFSISFWAYSNDYGDRSIYIATVPVSGWGFSIEKTTAEKIRVYWQGSPDYVASDFIVPNQEWFHITVVIKNKNCYCYKNGQLINSKTDGTFLPTNLTNVWTSAMLGRDSRTGVTVLNGKINDFRWYDHALSLKEIKQISKGLILHYPLQGHGLGNPNLYKTSYDFSGAWGNKSNWTTSSEDYNGFVVKQRSGTWGGLYQNITCSIGDIFTISFYAKIQFGGRICSVHRSNLGNVTTGLTILDGNFISGTDWINATDDGTEWKKYWATVKIDSSDITYLQWRIENSISGKNLYIAGFKLERGTVATEWIPNEEDVEYIALGFNDTIIYDESGYENNGIPNNITYSLDSNKYNMSAIFNGTDSYIYKDSNTPEAKTASFWIKFNNLNNQVVFADYKSKLGFGIYSNYLVLSCSESNSIYRKTVLKSVLDIDKFYFITIVRTDLGVLLYINGIQQDYHSVTDSWTSNITDKFTIGCRSNYTTLFNGNINDFRIYATALSAEDIKELYNKSAWIDRNKNFYTYNYKELQQGNEIEYLYNLNKSQNGTFSQDSEGLHLDQYVWVSHDYIPINPTNKTYKYDLICSIDAGNYFYIGWERYDANKTSRSNSACVYAVAVKPSSDLKYQRYRGTINLSTDGVNPCAFIKLRILNKWTGSESDTQGKATIHYLSLKQYSSSDNLTPLKISKTGITNTTEIWENSIGVSINRSQELNSNNFYEI